MLEDMSELFILIAHLLVTLAKLMQQVVFVQSPRSP
jgi:hypothetical protein